MPRTREAAQVLGRLNGAVLDAGALIGFERNDRRLVGIVARALHHGDALVVPAGVVDGHFVHRR